jgi:hypothetical protein
MPTCPNCGSKATEDARFCARCGLPLRDGGAGPPEVAGPYVLPAEGWDVCEIVWWRGYVKSEFYAVAGGQELARSPRFHWRSSDPPAHDHEAARRAHEQLVRRLTDAGWEQLGSAIPWYAQRFRRLGGLRLLPTEPGGESREGGSAQD